MRKLNPAQQSIIPTQQRINLSRSQKYNKTAFEINQP
jgi:hypothetical protein